MYPTGQVFKGFGTTHGRTVLTPGHLRRTPPPTNLNINIHKENYYNMGMPMYGGYGCHDCNDGGGMSTFSKILLGVGGLGAIAGGIIGALNGNEDGAGGTGKTETPDAELSPEMQAIIDDMNKALKEQAERSEQQIKDLQEQLKQLNEKKKANQNDEIARLKEESNKKYNISSEKVEEKKTTTTFNVKASKTSNGKVTGHTGYNIVAGMYTGPNGEALTETEIKALAKEIFKGKALPTGDIELPNEVTINGKTYKISSDPNADDKVKMDTYDIAQHQIFESTAEKVGEHWIGKINGKPIEGEFKTKEAAEEAARKQAEAENKTE